MKMRKEEAQEALNRSLSGLQADPRLAQRIIASEKGEFKVKKLSRAAIIIAAVIVLMMATALAAGLGGRVNWLGEIKPDAELAPSATPMPIDEPEKAGSAEEMDPHYYALLDDAKEREQIVISTENGGASSTRMQIINGMDEFDALVRTGADLPVPARIPDGYVFEKGAVEFGCLPEGKYVLASETVHPEGFTEQHYTVDPRMDFVRAYTLIFRNESDNSGDDGRHIQVNVWMATYTDPQDFTYGLFEGESARTIQVEGMENALLLTSAERRLLVMRKMMSAPRDDLLLLPGNERITETYCEYRIEVGGRQLTDDELIGVFAK